MSNYYWLKLHYDMLDDWKVGTLPDSLKWRFIQCLLIAGELDEGGLVGDINYLPEELSDRVGRYFLYDEMEAALELFIDKELLLKHGSLLYVSHLFGRYFEIGSHELNHTTNYKESLKSQRWKHYRNTVFIRDNFSCAGCGWGPPEVILHCHHLNYDRVGSESIDDCQTLCHICHAKEHDKAIVNEIVSGSFSQTLLEHDS